MKYDFHLKSGQIITVESDASASDVRDLFSMGGDGAVVLTLGDEITGIFDLESIAAFVPHIEPPAAFRIVKDRDGDTWIEYVPDRWLMQHLERTYAKLDEDFGPLTS